MASGLDQHGEERRQVCTLMYCLGEGAEDVLSSTNISEADRKKYSAVLSKFDGFFQVRKNVIFEHTHTHTHTLPHPLPHLSRAVVGVSAPGLAKSAQPITVELSVM